MFYLMLYLLNLLKDYYNYTIFKNLNIFKIMENYFLIKYLYFISWKNSICLLFLLNIHFKKYYILAVLNLIFILLGYSFFYENIYDLIFMPDFDLTDPLYKKLEPPFNNYVTNEIIINKTNEITDKIANNRIQKNESFYTFIFLTVSIFLIININK